MQTRIRIVCNECGHRWRVSPKSDPQCSVCGSVDFDVADQPVLTPAEHYTNSAAVRERLAR